MFLSLGAKMSSKALPYIFTALFVGAVLIGSYAMGSNHGKAKVNLLWAADTKKREDAIKALQSRYDKLEREHAEQSSQVTKELASMEAVHSTTIANMQLEFDKRLLDSNTRAGIYQRQATGSAAQQRDLASHAARLDTALEQGRQLVTELQAALRLREQQLHGLGQQIITDRKLFMDAGTPNGR